MTTSRFRTDRTALDTPLCDLLGIRYPIVKAPMGGGTDTPELTAAVSAAGGFGIFGAVLMSLEALRAAIRAIRALTDRPFGVNLVVHPPEPETRGPEAIEPVLARLRAALGLPEQPAAPAAVPPGTGLFEQLAVLSEERVPVLNTMGDPTSLIGPAQELGLTVLATVSTPAEAVQAATAGADVIVAQGAEAGGLRGAFRLGPDGDATQIGGMALIPAVVDALAASGSGGTPVLAAGGIMDGRGIAAALALGAEGVFLGTRFSAARESGIFPDWRARLLAAEAEDVVVSRAATGRPARAVRNRLVAQIHDGSRDGTSPLAFPHQAMALGGIMAAARERGDADFLYLAAGQGIGALTQAEPAGEIVAKLVEETLAALERLGA